MGQSKWDNQSRFQIKIVCKGMIPMDTIGKYEKIIFKILGFVNMNKGNKNYHNQHTYDYSCGYDKALRDVYEIILESLKEE